jgi:hypothetical protein
VSLAALRNRAQAAVVQVGVGFTQPGDDWAPVMFAQDGKGEVTVVGFPVLDDRDATVAILKAVLRNVGAVRYAIVLSSWAVTGEDTLALGPPSEHPARQEVLTLLLSDPETDDFYIAPILRGEGAPPRLGEWKRWSSVEGRFAGLLR